VVGGVYEIEEKHLTAMFTGMGCGPIR
jgi:pyrroline-5-carboxylate reductase